MIEHSPQSTVHGPQPTTYTRESSKGFTLIEVLIASVILATGLLLVIEGMSRGQQGMRTAENLVIASQLADEKMTESEIETRQLHRLNMGSDKGEEILPGKNFKWVKSHEPYSDASIPDATKLNRVDVEVQWQEGASRNNNLKMQTLVLNREKEQV